MVYYEHYNTDTPAIIKSRVEKQKIEKSKAKARATFAVLRSKRKKKR